LNEQFKFTGVNLNRNSIREPAIGSSTVKAVNITNRDNKIINSGEKSSDELISVEAYKLNTKVPKQIII